MSEKKKELYEIKWPRVTSLQWCALHGRLVEGTLERSRWEKHKRLNFWEPKGSSNLEKKLVGRCSEHTAAYFQRYAHVRMHPCVSATNSHTRMSSWTIHCQELSLLKGRAPLILSRIGEYFRAFAYIVYSTGGHTTLHGGREPEGRPSFLQGWVNKQEKKVDKYRMPSRHVEKRRTFLIFAVSPVVSGFVG